MASFFLKFVVTIFSINHFLRYHQRNNLPCSLGYCIWKNIRWTTWWPCSLHAWLAR